MKLRIVLFLVVSAFVFLSGCTSRESHTQITENPTEVVYFGKEGDWLATYSMFKVKNSWFESLYIQNISEDRGADVGPFEYELVGGEGYKFASQYPQKLQGVRSFQVSSEFNAELISVKPDKDGVFKLTIKYQEKEQSLTLNPLARQ